MSSAERHNAPRPPRPDDPYRDCAVYLEHGACVCSTGYPASCQADTEDCCDACDA